MDTKTKAEQLLYKYYTEDNFEIIDFEHSSKNKTKKCYIFFSSNGLYKNRNDIGVIEEMHRTHRYEWKFISTSRRIKNDASRIIFLRDIFKIFYIRGISSENNNIDRITELLVKLTNGMDVIIAGSSAGAYMSLLIGNFLPNTKRILTLGGISDLESFRSFSSYLDNNLKYCKYIDINDYLYGDYWIVNFYGKKNKYDGHNGELIGAHSNTKKLINVGFSLDVHAPRPSGEDLIKLLTCSDRHLFKLQKKINRKSQITETLFSIYNLGFATTYWNKFKTKVIKGFKKSNNVKTS